MWLDKNEMGHRTVESMKKGISDSKVRICVRCVIWYSLKCM